MLSSHSFCEVYSSNSIFDRNIIVLAAHTHKKKHDVERNSRLSCENVNLINIYIEHMDEWQLYNIYSTDITIIGRVRQSCTKEVCLIVLLAQISREEYWNRLKSFISEQSATKHKKKMTKNTLQSIWMVIGMEAIKEEDQTRKTKCRINLCELTLGYRVWLYVRWISFWFFKNMQQLLLLLLPLELFWTDAVVVVVAVVAAIHCFRRREWLLMKFLHTITSKAHTQKPKHTTTTSHVSLP